MKPTLYLLFAALAFGINAAPTPGAAPDRTYIIYGALGVDRVPGSGALIPRQIRTIVGVW
jgi:hypothetical protein